MIVPGIVNNDINCLGIRMFCFDFREQINGRISIDCVIKPRRRLKCFDVDRTIDIQPLAAAVGLELFFLSRLNPAVRRNAVVLWMGGIGKIDRVVYAFVCLELLIFIEKGLLPDRVLFAGNVRRLFVGKPKAMQ